MTDLIRTYLTLKFMSDLGIGENVGDILNSHVPGKTGKKQKSPPMKGDGYPSQPSSPVATPTKSPVSPFTIFAALGIVGLAIASLQRR